MWKLPQERYKYIINVTEMNSKVEVSALEVGESPLLIRSCGEGLPILFLHAGIADSRMWLPQVADLCSTFKLIAPDLRGYGGSPLPDHPFAYHEDIANLLDQLGIDKAWIVGNSFGAHIAVDFYLVFPGRVAGMVLVAPVIGGFQASDEIIVFNEQEEQLLEQENIEAATELNMRMWLDGPSRGSCDIDPNLRSQVAQMQRDAFHVPVPDGVEVVEADFVALERLEEISCPVLVLGGELDVQAAREHAYQIASRIPGARFQLIRDAGHLLSLEIPGRFNEILREFVTSSRSPL
jgi:pimeloyl-ACP methyl ester carboxylesterase